MPFCKSPKASFICLVVLPEKDRFKYLGMLLDRRINPKIAEEHAVQPYMAALSRISEFAKSYDLKSRPHAMLWLSKVYGIPAGMYASQVWGTVRMRYRDLFQRMFKTLRVFAPSSSEFIPFLTCHHSITDFEINAFLNQDSYRLLKFVSDLVSIFDTG